MQRFPSLDGFGPTRATLQRYARAMAALARSHAVARPHWRHISLRVGPDGLVTDHMPLPEGGLMAARMDFPGGQIVLAASDGRRRSWALDAGLSGTEMGDALIGAAAEWGLRGEVRREPFESHEPGTVDPDAAGRAWTAIIGAMRAFTRHAARLSGDVGPVQFWSHGFDLSVEWFGTRQVAYEEDGQTSMLPAQLNLGFYPGDDDGGSYFYSNPWPFEPERLLGRALPSGAQWHTEGWQGSILPYAILRDDPDPEARLLDYAKAVFDIALPGLTE